MANADVLAGGEAAEAAVPSPLDVLLWACRWNTIQDSSSLVPYRLAGVDWDAVIEGAMAHRIIPFLWTAVHDLPDVPAPALARLKELVKIQQVRALRRAALLLDLLALFERNAIPVMVLKGSILGQELYGHHWFRDSTDIDVLLRDDDADRATHLLAAWGYHDRIEYQHPRRRAVKRRTGCEVELINVDATKFRVELHWRLTQEEVACTIGVEEIWSRARTIEFMQRGVEVMAPEDLLMYLCVHGSKHDWVQLYLLCDLVRTVEMFPGLDWDHFKEIAERASARRRAAVGLLLAHRLLGLSLPASVMAWIQADPRTYTIVGAIETYILGGGSSWPPPWGKRFQYQSLEGWRSRVRYWVSTLRLRVEPGQNIIDALPLPPRLYAVYYVIWLVLVLNKVVRHAIRLIGKRDGSA